MSMQRRALVWVDGVLERQEASAHLVLMDQPAMQAAAVEPPALGLVGVRTRGIVVVGMMAS